VRSFLVCAVAIALFAAGIGGLFGFFFAAGVWLGSGSAFASMAKILGPTWPLIVTFGGAAIIIAGMYER
jgi:hypothetical protein